MAAAAAGSSGAPDEFQPQRSRNGCLTCRTRRVKCDEVRPICGRCSFGQRECGWGPEKPPNPRKRRRRPHTALLASSNSGAGPSSVPPRSNAARSTRDDEGSDSESPAAERQASGGPEEPPIDWLSAQSRKRLMMDPALLEHYFPQLDEMMAFRHYLATVDDLMAFTAPHAPFDPWVTIHAPLVFKEPGTSRVTDALRTAVLAVGAVRLRYVDDPGNQHAAAEVTRAARARVLRLLDPILAVPEAATHVEIEGTLAALLSCFIACTLAADTGWDAILGTAVALIDRLGGPHKVLERSHKNQYSVTRFVLEQLAVRDIIACLTLARRPCIIRQPFEPWFFEIESWSGKEVEWESVERQFGVTRGMVDVMARACSLIGVSREREAADGRVPRELQDAATGLLAELQVWDNGFNYTPYHTRTQYGNHCYRHAMRIALLSDVLGLDHTDDRVLSSSRAILELARELDFAKGPTMNWLLWPLLLSGFHIGPDPEMRGPLMNLLENPGPHMCFDTRAGIRLLKEVWAQQDAGVRGTHWQVVGGEIHRCLFAG